MKEITKSIWEIRRSVRSPDSLLRFRSVFTASRSANLAVPSCHTNATEQSVQQSSFCITAASSTVTKGSHNEIITLFSKMSQLYEGFTTNFIQPTRFSNSRHSFWLSLSLKMSASSVNSASFSLQPFNNNISQF